jgi:hypothetical protein
MGDIFSEKLRNMVPVVKRKQKSVAVESSFRSFHYAVMKSNTLQEFNIEPPYLKPAKKFMESVDSIKGKRIFIVAEIEAEAIKTAMYMLREIFLETEAGFMDEMSDEDYESCEFQTVYEENYGQMRVVDMSARLADGINGSNPYTSLALGIDDGSKVLFMGITEDDKLENRLDVIMGCDVGMQFVLLKPDQVDKPWARNLLMDKECEILHIPKTDIRYYVQILNELLDGERYTLDEELEPERLVRILMKKRGINKFCEEDIVWSLDYAAKRMSAKKKRYIFSESDFSFNGKVEITSKKRIQEMIGLDNAKQMIRENEALIRERMCNSKLERMCSHMIFEGNPGTGKTECAKIIAENMAEMGQNNGVFVEAARKDIVAGYIGHTAPKVAGLFAQARGGVLFVDEAGFFLHDSREGFNQEAIKEFVRYMEMYQDVTVIFALYPHEVEEWLEMEAGLSSRISRIVRFDDYTNDEMLEIARYMGRKRGYCLEGAADSIITDYIKKRRISRKKQFGNAREVRKLVEAAIFARSLRRYDDKDEETVFVLTKEDFKNGAARLISEEKERMGKRPIGFSAEGDDTAWKKDMQKRN